MRRLRIHEDGRSLIWEDGSAFFYLGDTAWEIFHKLNRRDAERYITVRSRQGFNVIQAVALAEFDGLRTPNAYGRFPLRRIGDRFDPAAPDTGGGYDYWKHVDYIIGLAAEKGLFIGLLPTWGDKYNLKWGKGPEIFTPGNARIYGRWIAEKYRNRWNIIWILGGDRPLETDGHRAVIRAMAEGIRDADPNHLISFHPWGTGSSADFVREVDLIDFHAVQSGHGVEAYESWKLLRRTAEAERKPFLDMEPRYEDHPACFKPGYGYLWDAADHRQNAYWNLMEGVCGHTYGNHSIWSFNTERTEYFPFIWKEVLRHEGAEQMRHLAALRLSRPFFGFHPVPELVADDSAPNAHIAAGRGDSYAFIYSPLGLPVRVFLKQMGGGTVRASWFDPRNGSSKVFGVFPAKEALFVPPSSGKGDDWILILDRLD